MRIEVDIYIHVIQYAIKIYHQYSRETTCYLTSLRSYSVSIFYPLTTLLPEQINKLRTRA